MTDVLYKWPTAATFGARIPKERFYERSALTSAVRERFVADVRRITWMYKLAEGTINLAPSADVPEIEVLSIEAKDSGVSTAVLAAIDRAIPNPVIFEIHRDLTGSAETQMVAAHKPIGAGSPNLRTYYATGWMPAASRREPLPTAITMPALYTALITPLTPIAARPGEEASEVARRLDMVRKLEREISALERKLRNEPQLNRKVELRRELKNRQAVLADLV